MVVFYYSGWFVVWVLEIHTSVVYRVSVKLHLSALRCLPRMVASYLVHHSYCATAEAFAKSTDQAVHEELASIKNRQSEYPASRTGCGCKAGSDCLFEPRWFA